MCAFCGATKGLDVGHVDGHEEHDAPDNLTWTCRPCNVIAGHTLHNAGLGRKTRQYNPSKSGGASSVGEWLQAVGAITPHVDRGDRGLASSMSVSEAVAMIRATPHHRRSEFAAKLRRHNPSIFGPGGLFGSRETLYDVGAAREAAREAGRAKPAIKARYRGYKIYRTPDGEYFSSLDPDSWYDTAAQVKRAIDSYKKGRAENPGSYRGKSVRDLEAMRAFASARAVDDDWMVRSRGRDDVAAIDKALKAARKREKGRVANPATRGNPPKVFYRDVDGKGRERFYHDANVGRRMVLYPVEEAKLLIATGQARAVAKSKRNPSASAAEAYEEFHGRPSSELVTVRKKVHHHKHLASAGDLKAIGVKPINRGPERTLQGFGEAILCFNEQKNQLFIEGGDQSLDAAELAAFGISKPHELETLGKVTNLDYFTTKDHLGDEGGTAVYQHRLRTTNENGQHVVVKIARYPDLIYRVLDEQLEFSGGSYTIRREGIDL